MAVVSEKETMVEIEDEEDKYTFECVFSFFLKKSIITIALYEVVL